MSLDTAERYQDAEFYVTMAGDLPPEFIREARRANMEKRIADPDNPLADWDGKFNPHPDHHVLNEEVPIDGSVTFYSPSKLEARKPFKYFDFPFRSTRKEGEWAARPGAKKFSSHPVWKWTNPDADPHGDLTLKPSLGIRGREGDIVFHAYIRGGGIEWL